MKIYQTLLLVIVLIACNNSNSEDMMNNGQPNSQPSQKEQLSTKFIGQTFRKNTNDSFGETIEQFSFSSNGSGEFYVAWTVSSTLHEDFGKISWEVIEDKIQVEYNYKASDGVLSKEKAILIYDETRNIVFQYNDNTKVFKSIASNNSQNELLNRDSSKDFFNKLQLKKLQNAKSTDNFGDELGLIAFSLPRNLFKLDANLFLKSDALSSTLSVFFSETSQVDSPDAIWKKSDLINAMKKNLDVKYFTEKKDWAVVSGYNKAGNIVYKKGFYFKPENNFAGEDGENTQPWCQTVVIELEYPTQKKEEYDRIIGDLIKSLKVNFDAINDNN